MLCGITLMSVRRPITRYLQTLQHVCIAWWDISGAMNDDDAEKPHGAASFVDQADSIRKNKSHRRSYHND